MEEKVYDLIIVGGGITGASCAFVATKYTNIKSVAMIEKECKIGELNSSPLMNSATLHFGDIETNYDLEKARTVKKAADMVVTYMTQTKRGGIFRKCNKMVLGIGAKEIALLESRFENIKRLFPSLRKIDRNEIQGLEPGVIAGRDTDEPILALYSEDGYAVNFQALSNSFIEDSSVDKERFQLYLSKAVIRIEKCGNIFKITTDDQQTLLGKSIIVAAGGKSLVFAKKFGTGDKYAILPVAGNFYEAPDMISGKVYRVQIEGIPFAAIHGDADILNNKTTRFGPTTQFIPLLERRRMSSFKDFLEVSIIRSRAIKSLLSLAMDFALLKFVLINLIYGLPVLGKWLFLKSVRKIIPNIQWRELKFNGNLGGLRPQVINMETCILEKGEVKIVEDRIIFDITPSPGASVCLANAEYNIRKIVSMLGPNYRFEEEKFEKVFKDQPS